MFIHWQEDNSGVASQQDGALAEIIPRNNSSAIHARHSNLIGVPLTLHSGSIFHNANNFVVYDGTFCAAHNLVVKKLQDYDRTTQGIVEGADVFTLRDVPPKKEFYKGRGYRVYSSHSGTAKARAVKIKLYEGSCAKDCCLAAASFSQKVIYETSIRYFIAPPHLSYEPHPNVLHLIGVSPLNSEFPFLVFDESTEWAIESVIASALSKGLKQSLFLGLQTLAGLSSGLDYLRTLLYLFASVGLDHFVVSFSHHGNIVISLDPEALLDDTHEQYRPSQAGGSDDGNELDIFHGLCQKTFDAACKAHYEFQKVRRSDLDELDADHDVDEDRFEEIKVDAGTLLEETKDSSISDILSSAPSAPQLHAALPDASSMSSRRPFPKASPSARRRELIWSSHKNETVSLEEIARKFQSFLLTFSAKLGFDRRRSRYTTKTAHRCPGYDRIEITLAPDIARSAIVSHLTPIPNEICPVCKEIVKDAEIFACICGRDDDESIPTIRCSTCSEWHHRPCVSISENKDQSFVCQRCKVRTKVKPNKRDSFGHFTKDDEAAHGRYDQTKETSLQNTVRSKIPIAFHPSVGTIIDGGSLELVEILGVGGHAFVYRAIDTRHHAHQRTYAVKCLVTCGDWAAIQRQIYMREIALHQVVSAHPGIVTLHRVVEQGDRTYIIMDYAPDHDLSAQILRSFRYLGDEALIKDVFLQLLDAVEYCHSLGIYHRDLKSENILCFDNGLRIAIADFGLATTDRFSDEFQMGSPHCMSPECQGGEFAPTGNYSPAVSDIWSLGIILLELVTGREAWSSATSSDPVFPNYLSDPLGFLPTILPISPELNGVLTGMLDVDWRQRITLREVRHAMAKVTSLYSHGVVFERSKAYCPWESRKDIDDASESIDNTSIDHTSIGTPEYFKPFPKYSKDIFANLSSEVALLRQLRACQSPPNGATRNFFAVGDDKESMCDISCSASLCLEEKGENSTSGMVETP